ncbi:MAG: GAF domain-containing protein [Anaerolineae bacterium]|nr:GAF domain-containing protein [Anaerolineae bacterium]
MPTELTSLESHDRATQKAAVSVRLDAMTLDALPRVALVSGMGYLIGIVYHLLAPEYTGLSVALLIVSVLLSFALRGALRTWTLSSRHAPAVTAALVALALLNALHSLFASGGPRAAVLLMLVTVSTGLLLVRTLWFGLMLGLSLAGWLVAMLIFSTPAGWISAGFDLLLASALAVGVHAVRRANCAQIARLYLQGEAQTASLKRRIALVETSRAIVERFSAIDDMDTLLQHATDNIGTNYGCTYVGIFLLDENTAELVARAGTGSAGRAAIQAGARVKVGRGIIGWVAENRRVAYARDTARDPRFVIWDLLPDTRSELTLPLHVGEALLGVLDVQSERPNAFHDEDVTALQLMADHIALVVQNMLLRQVEKDRRRLMETLQHVGRSLSRSMDTQAAFTMILQQLATVIPYDRGSIMLQNDTLLELVAARGFPGSKRAFRWRVPVRAGDVYDEIRRTQKPLILDDALRRADWFHLRDLLPARSWVGIPLIHEDSVIGMLSLARETYAPFTEDEITFATLFAWQATIVLQNARLSVELQEKTAKPSYPSAMPQP